MTVGEIKNMVKDHGMHIDNVMYFAASRFRLEEYCTILYPDYPNMKRRLSVWGETLEDLYTNLKECCLKSNTEKTSLS